jgi:transposase InsO family protein
VAAPDLPMDLPVVEPEAPKEKVDVKDIARLQRNDPALLDIIKYLVDKELPENAKAAAKIKYEADKFVMADDRLHRLWQASNRSDPVLQLVAPQELRRRVFRDHHNGAMAGHLGIAKTYHKLLKGFWWEGMHADVTAWIASCKECCGRKGQAGAQNGLLQPIEVTQFLDTIAMDILELPKTDEGYRYVLVFAEYVSRFVITVAMKRSDARSVADALISRVFPLFGAARRLLSDNGGSFNAVLMQEICKILRIHKIFTSTYRPQTDGLVERMNGTLQAMLSKFVATHQKDWPVYLPFVTFAYNSSPQASTGESPFFLLFGRDPHLPSDLSLAPSKALSRQFKDVSEYRSELVRILEEARSLAREHLSAAQANQKRRYDATHKEAPFVLGDRVWLFTPRVEDARGKKLARMWVGPYRIIALRDTTAKLRNIESGKDIKQSVHVGRLKPYHQPPNDDEMPLGEVDSDAFNAGDECDAAFQQSGDQAIFSLLASSFDSS